MRLFALMISTLLLVGCASIGTKIGDAKEKLGEVGTKIDQAQLDWLKNRIERKNQFECGLKDLGFKITVATTCEQTTKD